MKHATKLLALLLALTLALGLAACSAGSTGASSAASEAASESAALPTTDPAGNAITLPETINSVVVMAPSIAETLMDLGCTDKIKAIDTQTQAYAYADLSADLPAFDMMTPDTEKMAALKPDVVFVSGMSSMDGTNPFEPLQKLGICVVCIPSADSIDGIKSDIRFLAACMGKTAEGEKIVTDLESELKKISDIGASVTDKKTVYFEIAAAPSAYSFGSGTFLNEMIELIGAKNVFADQQSWISVDNESAIAANPDVILTNVNYIDDPVSEILSRAGWDKVTAVVNKNVYYIDNQSSSLPNEHIVKALQQMAAAVYPDLYPAAEG